MSDLTRFISIFVGVFGANLLVEFFRSKYKIIKILPTDKNHKNI